MEHYLHNILSFARQLGPEELGAENLSRLRGSRPDGIIIVGMGGSGLAGEILRSAGPRLGLRVPVFLWKDYGLPPAGMTGLRRPLCICVSFSGDTEETLSGLREALRLRPRPAIGIVAGGGALLLLGRHKRLPLVSFAPGELTPRQAVGKMFYGLTELLLSAALLPKPAPTYYELVPQNLRKEGEGLARRLRGRLTLLYTDWFHRDAGYVWKARLNETAKQEAFLNFLPEMNHNELVSSTKLHFPAAAVILLPQRLSSRMSKRFAATEKLLRSHRLPVLKVELKGKDRLEETWRAAILADWTAYALAKLNGVEPAEVKIVDQLKAAMRR